MFAANATARPDRIAVVMAGSGDTRSYAELEERSRRLARWWWEQGLRPGDRVALLADNLPCVFEVYWAAMRSGLHLATVNRYATTDEAAYILADSDSSAIVVSAGHAEVAADLVHRDPAVVSRLIVDGSAPGHTPYEDALASVGPEPLPEQPRGELLLYSSGTTGRPKGVERPLTGLAWDDPSASPIASLQRTLLGMGDDAVYLSPAPLYHAAPLAWSAAVHDLGGTVVVMERFDPEEALAAIEEHAVTHAQFVPTMFVRMLKLPPHVRADHDLSSLRRVVHAAAPCPVEVKRRMIDWWGPIIDEYYSATEGHGLTFITADDWLDHPGSVGRPVRGTPHICDDNGVEVDAGTDGLVYFERDAPPFAYRGRPADTAAARHPRHPTWTAVGDIGHLDDEGYLYLTDRAAFTIISGGVNIYPQEIEDALVLHDEVADVAVFAIPDPEMGESVHAVVQPAHGVVAGDELTTRLLDHLRSRLAAYKIPRSVEYCAALPREDTGKLAKRRLRDGVLARLEG